MKKFCRAVFLFALALIFVMPEAVKAQNAPPPTDPAVTSPTGGQTAKTAKKKLRKRRRRRKHRRKLL